MKLFSSFPKILLVGVLFLGIASATSGDLRNWMDNLSDEIPFGYATSQKITASTVTAAKVVITSPVIEDELGNKIKKYTVMYGGYPLADILEDTALLDQSEEKTFDFATVGSSVNMELTVTGDHLSTGLSYISIIPKDQNGILGEISNEIWVNLTTLTSGEGIYSGGTHGVAGADFALANVSHTFTTTAITLTWTEVDGSDKVDIFLWDPVAQTFNKLGTANMSAERFEFPRTRNGEFIVKFMPNSGGKEKVYTFTLTGTVAPAVVTTGTSTVIRHVPRVGPAENLLVALFIAFVLYLLYRRSVAHRK